MRIKYFDINHYQEWDVFINVMMKKEFDEKNKEIIVTMIKNWGTWLQLKCGLTNKNYGVNISI